MPNFPLTIIAGSTARKRLTNEGWQPELFTAMVGASGGAKLLGLGHLDRYLFGEYLTRASHSMELYGSSIGSWRHAALASINPGKAIATLQDRYMNQQWARSPSEVVDGLCEWVLDSLLTSITSQQIHVFEHMSSRRWASDSTVINKNRCLRLAWVKLRFST